MLHVVTARSRAAGVPEDGPALAGWDMLAEMVRGAQKNLDQSLGLELEGLAIRCVLVKGDPARAILQTAQLENADLIMMPSHGYTFDQFLLGSVTAKVLHRTECPVWTGAARGRIAGARSSRSETSCAPSISGLVVAKLCRGPRKWLLSSVPVLRSPTSLPLWNFGDQAAPTSIYR